MIRTLYVATVLSTAVMVSSCSTVGSNNAIDSATATAAPGLQDGELAVPENYRSWPVFLSAIDKTDGKQIRDIYINPIGHETQAGEEFPHGTISVMELWDAKVDSAGELATDADGKLLKEQLKLIFLMGKSLGAGQLVDPELRNGDWVYAGYQADGVTPGGPDAAACRSCHLAEAEKDWVFRYDEYFSSRGD